MSRYRDVDLVFRNLKTRVQPAAGEFPKHIGDGPASTLYRLTLLTVDSPEHNRLRRVISTAFNPRSVAGMEDWMVEIIDRRLRELQNQDVVDVVPTLANNIPVDIGCRLLHIPPGDGVVLVERMRDLVMIFLQGEFTPDALSRADQSASFFFEYFRKHLEKLPRLPDGDLVGAVIKAGKNGVLSEEDMVAMMTDIFMASYHTSWVSLANAVELFGRFAEQRKRLLADPSLSTKAWNEVLRYAPAVHFRHRYLSEPATLHGVRIEPGVRVLLGLASANWDEAVFEDPDRFDISRPLEPAHIAFGGGSHYCLGAYLARLEGSLFLPRFLKSYPDYRVLDTAPLPTDNMDIPFFPSLPIELRHSPVTKSA